MNAPKNVGHTATLLLAALTVLAGLALPNGVGVPTGVSIGETAPAAMGQDPWAVWSHKQYDPVDKAPFTRELFERHIAPIDNEANSWDGYVATLDPAPDLETQVLRLPDMNLDALVSSRLGQGSVERAHARRVAREMVKNLIKNGSSLMTELYQSGQLAGVEIDWHHAEHMRPQSEMTLPVVGAVFTSSQYTDVLIAYIYAYSEPQLIARRQDLELTAGQPLVETTTWATPVLSAKKHVVFDGNDLTVAGDVNARERVIVNGSDSSVAGTVTFGQSLDLNAMVDIDGPVLDLPPGHVTLAPVPFSQGAARQLARQAGMHVHGDLHLEMPPANGTVIFAEGDVFVHAWGWTRSFTVFAKGSIHFFGADATLTGAESDTLAVSYNGDVDWELTNSTAVGLVACPTGQFRAMGGECVFHGPITADVVKLVSNGHQITDGSADVLDPGQQGGMGMPMAPPMHPMGEGDEAAQAQAQSQGGGGGQAQNAEPQQNGQGEGNAQSNGRGKKGKGKKK